MRLVKLKKKESDTANKIAKTRSVCGGILWYKYYGTRKLIKSGNIKSSKKGATDDCDLPNSAGEEKEFEDLIQWLRNSKAPWIEVLENWKKTAPQRLKEIQTTPGDVHDYVSQYPALQDTKGYTLLELDFKFLYPDSHFCLFGAWKQFAAKLAELLKEKFRGGFPLEGPDIPDDLAAVVLRWLPKLVPPAVVLKKDNKQWRPSQLESQDAFLLHVKTVGDIQPKLEARRLKLHEFGLKVQPQAIVVGDTLQTISGAFVSIDEYLYEVGTPLKAVDATFKAFQALHAAYPPEAEPMWLFLQQQVYRIFTKFDKKFIPVSTLLAQFKK